MSTNVRTHVQTTTHRYERTVETEAPVVPDDALEVPVSHLTRDQANLLYQTLNSLLTHTNRIVGVVDTDRVAMDGPCLERKLEATRVSEVLWADPDTFVDSFVSDNPDDLPSRHLACANRWRHAIRTVLTCCRANSDYALYSNGERIFAVGAMEGDADDLVHAVPSLMVLTLLPFEGGIVTDGQVMHLSDEPVEGMAPVIEAQFQMLMQVGPITTACELVDYSRDTLNGTEPLGHPGTWRELDPLGA